MLVDALIVTKIRGIKRRNTDNVLNSFCPLVEKDKSPSAQNHQGISRLEWDEKDTGKSEVITDHNRDCIFRNCKKYSAINTLQESIIKQNPEVDWSKQVTWHQWQYICRAHWDGGSSQGSTKHSLPPARRRGSFNSNDQLNSSTER